MKLYVIDPKTEEKHYLKQNAQTREELATLLKSKRFKIEEQIFSVEDVKAESSEHTAGAMALGGVIGVMGGVPGVIIGGILGGLLGKSSDDDDQEKADLFNRSKV